MKNENDNVETLATDLVNFYWNFDPYEFRDQYDNMDEAYESCVNLLENDPKSVFDMLSDVIESMEDDDVEMMMQNEYDGMSNDSASSPSEEEISMYKKADALHTRLFAYCKEQKVLDELEM